MSIPSNINRMELLGKMCYVKLPAFPFVHVCMDVELVLFSSFVNGCWIKNDTSCSGNNVLSCMIILIAGKQLVTIITFFWHRRA